MSESVKADSIDLCAQEPIRIPGGIQPHGALLVLDPDNLRMRQASTNLTDKTGLVFSSGSMDWIHGNGAQLHAELASWLKDTDKNFLRTIALGPRSIQVNAHHSRQGVL